LSERDLEERAFLHDLSNPLAIAVGMLDMAAEQLKTTPGADPKALERLEKARNALRRMTDSITARRKTLQTRS
jgi:signal transduction histidine kinase